MTDYVKDGTNFLEHFGKKGMKWGVRQDYKSWKKESTSAAAGSKVVDAAIKSFQPDLKKINNDPMFKGKDLTKDKKLNRQYQELAAARFNDHLVTHSINQSATTMHGGRAVVWQMGLGPGGPRYRPVIMKPVAKHASVEPDLSNLPSFDVVLDDKGFIVDIKLAMEHSSIASGEDFLEHFGKKGMKWGVRKQTAKDGRAGNSPPMNPHQKAALEATKGAKRGKDKTVYKKGPKQLTDEQLKARINRMQLEKQYKDLNAEPVGKGKKMVEEVISNSGKQIATTVLVGAGLLAVKSMLGKKFGEDVASAVTGKGSKKKSGAEKVVEEALNSSKRKPGAF